MSIRNLDALFRPKVIAVVGASNRPGTVGAVLAANLFAGGFAGPILAVNPREEAVHSTLNYRSVAELPLVPDLAVIATPPLSVPSVVSDLAAKGCRAAVVVTAGFGEGDRAEGQELRTKVLAAARPALMRIVGPNCLGFMSPVVGINASFAHRMPPAGGIALVTQSGALATTMIDWGAARGTGFSHVVSLGDMIDVDFGDLLDFLALDRSTRAILLYVEGVTQARKFMSAARAAARTKPVVVLKGGRSRSGARAALSHTGALAGTDLVYDAAFRRAGLLRVREMREAFDALTTLATGPRIAGESLAIMTNGGGLGVIAVDALSDHGGRLADLSSETIAALDAHLPKVWSRSNPVDLVGDARGDRYTAALAALLADPGSDAVLVMNCPTAVADSRESADAVAALVADRHPLKPILTCWAGEGPNRTARDDFAARQMLAYESPEDAVRAFTHLVEYRRSRIELLETPAAVPEFAKPDHAAARRIIDGALAAQRTVLTAPETKALLSAYRVPVVAAVVAKDATDAGRIAATLSGPIALKILSPDISHKSDVGGVRLDLPANAVEHAAVEMWNVVRQEAPQARLEGFTVEPMATRGGYELLAGIADDPTFGPIILFGHGGTATEAIADRDVALPPLNGALARQLILRTRVARLLQGYRNQPPVALDPIVSVLLRLSEFAADFPEVVELDINPLVATSSGVQAVDARAGLRAGTGRAPGSHMAIRPYPAELTHAGAVAGGTVWVRPIRPQDEAALTAMVLASTAEDIRLRFFEQLKDFPHELAARLSQIDYDREMALVATPSADSGEILGVARLAADPDNLRAEYAVMVRSDQKGRGIGFRLMSDLLAYARGRGIKTIFGEVLSTNTAMLQMVRELAFTVTGSRDDPTVLQVERVLA